MKATLDTAFLGANVGSHAHKLPFAWAQALRRWAGAADGRGCKQPCTQAAVLSNNLAKYDGKAPIGRIIKYRLMGTHFDGTF